MEAAKERGRGDGGERVHLVVLVAGGALARSVRRGDHAVRSHLLALVYVGGVVALQGLLRALTGQGSSLAVLASTLAIAALLSLLRRRVQALLSQEIRRQEDAERLLGQTARRDEPGAVERGVAVGRRSDEATDTRLAVVAAA